MSDEKKEEASVTHIDDKRVDRLKTKASYHEILDAFDLLRIKLLYGEPITVEEGYQLVTLTKYIQQHGHNEQIKIMAKHLYQKYMKHTNL